MVLPRFLAEFRRKFSIGYGGSFYDFNTTLLRSESNLLKLNSTAFESNITIAKIDPLRSIFIELVHEQCHWLQHQSSTFGAFISALHSMRDTHALYSTRILPEPLRSNLCRARIQGSPIMSTQNDITAPYSGDDWLLPSGFAAKKLWYSYLCAEDFFMDGFELDDTGYKINCIVTAIVFMYMLFGGKKTTQMPLLEPDETRKMISCLSRSIDKNLASTYEFDLIGDILLGTPSEKFSTRSLLETSATITEILYLMTETHRNNPQLVEIGGQYVWDRITSLFESSYLTAVRGLLIHLRSRRASTQLLDVLPSILAAIEVALEPPLPPRIPFNPVFFRLEQLFPPLRFIHVMGSLEGDLLSLSELGDQEKYKAYKRLIAEAANIIYLPHTSHVLASDKAEMFQQWSTADVLPPSDILNTVAFEDWATWVQDNIRSLRRTEGVGYISDVVHHFGYEAHSYCHFLFPALALNEYNQILRVGGWPETMQYWLLDKILLDHCLFDFLAGCGDVSWLPEGISLGGDIEVLRSQLQDQLSKCLDIKVF